ncbi:hypothetical protein AY607_12710 [Acinetobacter sp. SFA]|nr:hypothetical protein AY607_12710 [Acinetobacter sp. SFA]
MDNKKAHLSTSFYFILIKISYWDILNFSDSFSRLSNLSCFERLYMWKHNKNISANNTPPKITTLWLVIRILLDLNLSLSMTPICFKQNNKKAQSVIELMCRHKE